MHGCRDDHFFEFASSTILGLSITDALGGYIEYFTIKPDHPDAEDSESANAGLTHIFVAIFNAMASPVSVSITMPTIFSPAARRSYGDLFSRTYKSTWIPSTTTRSEGIWYMSVRRAALRDMKANSRSRHNDIPATSGLGISDSLPI